MWLPMRAEEITPEWLTQVLGERFPGAQVTAMEHADFISGTGSKLRLKLAYNEAGHALGLPPSMICKGGMDWYAYAYKASYQAEAVFFDRWRDRLDANLPKGYWGGANEEQGLSLMEDLNLRNASFSAGVCTPLAPEVVQQIIALLAGIHATLYEDAELRTLRTLGQRVGLRFADDQLSPDHYAMCLSQKRGSWIPRAFHDPPRMRASMEKNWELSETGPQTFVHGDAHQGNLFFDPDGTPGFLDFAAYVRCTPLHDIAYLVVGSLSPADRRAHDRDLLRFYLAEMQRLGVTLPWSFDEAFGRFKAHTAHGMLWFATPTEMQPMDVIEVHGERFGTAAGDYDLAGILGV